MKITKQTMYRALRTFIQTFVATACADVSYICASEEINWKIILTSVIIPAFSTAMATIMNLEEHNEQI